jgi:hypothetical protein
VELSDGDNDNERNKPASNEAEGKEAPWTEPITHSPTESNVAGDTRPSAVGQIAIVSSGSGQKKKNVLLAGDDASLKELMDPKVLWIQLM